MSFLPVASAAQDVDDHDREVEEASPDPFPTRPAAGPSDSCGIKEFGAAVEVEVGLQSATLVLPTLAGSHLWRVDGNVLFGEHHARWTEDAAPGTSLPVALPADAFVDPYQSEWLSRVDFTATAVGAKGRELGSVELDPVWVVWENGPSKLPRWFDRASRAATAPLGAWSARAREQIAHIDVPFPATTELDPPRSSP